MTSFTTDKTAAIGKRVIHLFPLRTPAQRGGSTLSVMDSQQAWQTTAHSIFLGRTPTQHPQQPKTAHCPHDLPAERGIFFTAHPRPSIAAIWAIEALPGTAVEIYIPDHTHRNTEQIAVHPHDNPCAVIEHTNAAQAPTPLPGITYPHAFVDSGLYFIKILTSPDTPPAIVLCDLETIAPTNIAFAPTLEASAIVVPNAPTHQFATPAAAPSPPQGRWDWLLKRLQWKK